jgi:hypothetical protein
MAWFLPFGEPQVAVVIDGADAILEAAQDGARAVGGGVVHHHDLRGDSFLLQNAFQTTANVPLAVEGDDGYAYLGVGDRFQGFETKTLYQGASTTLGYENDRICPKKM